MKSVLLSCFLLTALTPVQAQGLIKYALRGAQRASACSQSLSRGVCARALLKGECTVTGQAGAQGLEKALKKQVQTVLTHHKPGPMHVWNGLERPLHADEKELFPVAHAAAFILHPQDRVPRLLAERWFRDHAHYAAVYAHKKNGSSQDMLRYFIAKVYANCLVNKSRYPQYALLENLLERDYSDLDYKFFYQHEL